MRHIGLIVDGQSEYQSLPLLTAKIDAPDVQFLRTLYAPIQPYASAGVVARACRSPIEQLVQRGATDVVVAIDREARSDCPGVWAAEILNKLEIPSDCQGWVVIKDRTFESWLVADVEALKASPKRFNVSPAIERRVNSDKADSCDALRLLKEITRPSYSKVADSRVILTAADPLRIANNSRSFRRFMRISGHPNYALASRRPAR